MFANCTYDDLRDLPDDVFEEIEREVDRLMSVWEVKNLRAELMLFHDDQHIGEPRRQLMATNHPAFDVEELISFETKPVVDSLEGNMLIHPCTTPILEIDGAHKVCRGLWWSFGMESLSKHREKPLAMISLGMMPTIALRQDDGEWRLFLRGWQRTAKTDMHKGWVDDMQPTNCRPPLTREQDQAGAGKYAYYKDRIRMPTPEPPHKDTFQQFPGEINEDWLYCSLHEKSSSWDIFAVGRDAKART